MNETEKFKAIIIGSGQAGKPLAVDLAKAGWKTAIIERGHVGGVCINAGCTPTKTMIASARVAYQMGRAADYGLQIDSARVDMPAVRKRKQAMVESFREANRNRLEDTENLELIMGQARFTGPDAVEVQMQNGKVRNLTAEKIFVNTGCRPIIPELPGLADISYLNSTTIMDLEEIPQRLLIIGGGYIGLEFGQMFRRFGSEVTIVQRNKQLLPREDEDVADEVAKILREDGIEILLDANVQQVRRSGDGKIEVNVKDQDGDKTVTGSHLLVAVGRIPNTEALDLDAAGVHIDKPGYVHVNERLATNIIGVYALGDVKGGPAFTHLSYDDYRIAKTNLLEDGNATTAGRLVPYTVFIDPQLGRVGLSEKEARDKGLSIKVAKLPMTWVAQALERDETRGFLKAVVDAKTNQILGCAALSTEGGELMSMIQIAMMAKLPYTALRDAIFSHPSLSESLNNLFAYGFDQ